MAEYFSHDYNARADLKLSNLIMGMGYEGLGLYWCLVEILYEAGGYITLEQIPIISHALQIVPGKVEKVLKEFKLFEKIDDKYFSKSILERLKERKKVFSAKSRAAKIMHKKQREIKSAYAQQKIILCTDSKEVVKESKVNKIKEVKETTTTPTAKPAPEIEPTVKKRKVFEVPTVEQVSEYVIANKLSINPTRFHAYYTSNGWRVGKNPMKNWKAAVITWQNKE